MRITPSQCRAGRAMLGITRQQLSVVSGVSHKAIANFETGRSQPINANVMAIRMALEKLGIVFYDNGSVGLREE